MRQFNSDADVQKHFALQGELAVPSPPEDLWERLDRAQREARRRLARKFHPLSQPDLSALVFPETKSERKAHLIRVVERLDYVPDVRLPRRRTHSLKGVP